AQKSPSVGYLTGMREAGQVDLGYVAYPNATKASQGWVLLNGIPAVVNVDDLSLLPQTEMQKDPLFNELRKSHPQIQLRVTNDHRSPDSSPLQETLADGGERFIVSYALQDGPDSGASLAQATFAFDFDAAGEFVGAKFIKVIR